MMEIKLKRVYDDAENSDGLRVLVDKLWPRGVKKEALKYDMWEKEITPSTSLRQWFHEDQEANWKQFAELYTKELEGSQPVKDFIKKISREKTITLLYASKNKEHNHALVLKEYLEKNL